MAKAFYLKYYPPIEAYRDRGIIYNFWPHPKESIGGETKEVPPQESLSWYI
jgi:hypothetical protein